MTQAVENQAGLEMREDAEPLEQVERPEGGAPPVATEAQRPPDAVGYFMKGFASLCRCEEEYRELAELAKEICDKWGAQGCDLVVAFKDRFQGLDFDRLKTAVRVFAHYRQERLQSALEQFWWLMGMGGHHDLLADGKRFETFSRLMTEQGLDACKRNASIIRSRIREVTGESS